MAVLTEGSPHLPTGNPPWTTMACRLQPYDESGRLHLYVSPSIRTLQTLAPLASRLTTTPIVKPEITECPGMMRGTDRTKVWPRIHRAEMNEDWATVAKIDAEMEGKWLRSGLTRSQINDRFPVGF